VVPCWNQAHFLSEALESVLAQDYDPIEVIVVDDGSDDNTSRVAARYPEVRYRYQPNKGASAARNAGRDASSGSLIAFLDADDRMLHSAVAIGVGELKDSGGAAFAVGGCRDIGPSGQPQGAPVQPLIHRDHYLALLKSCFILSGSSIMFNRWCLDAVGGFDERYRVGDDYDLYLRIARRFRIHCHGRVVTEYRRHASSLTQDPASTLAGELRALKAQRSVLRSREERKAMRSGRRRARETHGHALRYLLFEQLQRRTWARACRSSGSLLRHYPRGLMESVLDLRRISSPVQ
jgi:glycosyltransferase involved in cell wall biosynthesis